jgi:hsp70-interacting protein
MGDKRLNDLLKWSIEHTPATNGTAGPPPKSDLTPELLAALMGGPSDADLMKASIEIITNPNAAEVTLEDKVIAFDNFEQLIENLDNANNIANLGLWPPLLEQLRHDEAELRKMAAWCVGTAVQNNEKTQERLHFHGGVPVLVEMALREGETQDVRRKATYALSSAVRNYQPAMDDFAVELTKNGIATETADAAVMENVDKIIADLREKIKAAS